MEISAMIGAYSVVNFSEIKNKFMLFGLNNLPHGSGRLTSYGSVYLSDFPNNQRQGILAAGKRTLDNKFFLVIWFMSVGQQRRQ